jgi:hypothetical protein
MRSEDERTHPLPPDIPRELPLRVPAVRRAHFVHSPALAAAGDSAFAIGPAGPKCTMGHGVPSVQRQVNPELTASKTMASDKSPLDHRRRLLGDLIIGCWRFVCLSCSYVLSAIYRYYTIRERADCALTRLLVLVVIRRNQPMPCGPHSCLHAVRNSQFSNDMFHMRLDCTLRHEKDGGSVAV